MFFKLKNKTVITVLIDIMPHILLIEFNVLLISKVIFSSTWNNILLSTDVTLNKCTKLINLNLMTCRNMLNVIISVIYNF